MSHIAEIYRFHSALVLAFLGFVVVYAIAQWRGGGPRIGGRE